MTFDPKERLLEVTTPFKDWYSTFYQLKDNLWEWGRKDLLHVFTPGTK